MTSMWAFTLGRDVIARNGGGGAWADGTFTKTLRVSRSRASCSEIYPEHVDLYCSAAAVFFGVFLRGM